MLSDLALTDVLAMIGCMILACCLVLLIEWSSK
jgi:hypothetical protein